MIREGFFPTLIYANDFNLNTNELAENILKWSKEDKGIVERMFFKLLTKISLKNADIYTVTSEDDINFLNNEFRINSNKIFLIRNWVDIDKNINFNDRIENKILCVGRLVPQKNYFFLR